MSTHNLGFYEDLTKLIFELSSNIIKYAPYFFCCYLRFLFRQFSFSLDCNRFQFVAHIFLSFQVFSQFVHFTRGCLEIIRTTFGNYHKIWKGGFKKEFYMITKDADGMENNENPTQIYLSLQFMPEFEYMYNTCT